MFTDHVSFRFYVFGGFGDPDLSAAYEFQFVFYNMLWVSFILMLQFNFCYA